MLTLLKAALEARRFNEAALLLRRAQAEETGKALELAKPHAKQPDLALAVDELKARTRKGSK